MLFLFAMKIIFQYLLDRVKYMNMRYFSGKYICFSYVLYIHISQLYTIKICFGLENVLMDTRENNSYWELYVSIIRVFHA